MSSREQAKTLGLEENITCPLCQDYLNDAVTLKGCLHFFCRFCLLQHVNSRSPDSRKCPKCKIEFSSDERFYKRDLRLQELVYKLVPDLFWRKLRRVAIKHNRSSRDSNNTSTLSERRIQQRRMLIHLSTQLCSPNEKISLEIVYVPLNIVLAANGDYSLIENSAENIGKQVGEQIVKQVGENVCVSEQIPSSSSSSSFIIPSNICERKDNKIIEIEHQQQKHNFSRYFRCSAKVKIEHLKRLLESKLTMTEFYGVYFIDPEFRFLLEDDFSLEDLVQLFSWSRKAPLQLHFTLAQLPPKEDEDRPSALEDMPQLDLESGPMEQVLPIIQQLQSPSPPIIITQCQNLNEISNKQQIMEKVENSIEKPNEIGEIGITKIALASSLLSPSASICDNSIRPSSNHTPLLSSPNSLQNSITTTILNSKDVRSSSTCTSPTASTVAIPRLSTVGVSPLRPVPSLQPIQQPTNINNNISKDKPPNNIRKRQKNTSSTDNNNIQKKTQNKQEKSKVKIMQQESYESQHLQLEKSNSQNMQKETSKPKHIQQERSKSQQKSKASVAHNSFDNGLHNGSSCKRTSSPTLTNVSSINPSIFTIPQQQHQSVAASDYVNLMQNLFHQYHQQQNRQQHQQQTSPQFPPFLPTNIFGQQPQQQLNSQQMRAMANQMLAMGMFSSGIPFSSDQFLPVSFPLSSSSTEHFKTSENNNKKVLQNNSANTPIKAKKAKLSSNNTTSQVFFGSRPVCLKGAITSSINTESCVNWYHSKQLVKTNRMIPVAQDSLFIDEVKALRAERGVPVFFNLKVGIVLKN